MAGELKFNFKQLHDLDRDWHASSKAAPLVVQKILSEKMRELRNSMRGGIPRASGRLARAFNFSVRRSANVITARLGFFAKTRSTSVAANVLQKGFAAPSRGKYLWIPLPWNRDGVGEARIDPRTVVASGFIRDEVAFMRTQGQAVPMFILKTRVRLSRPPLPLEKRVEAALPEILAEIPETMRQVIEAKKVASGVIGG